MIITNYAKALLAARRERRRLLALGYFPHETDPEITRGRRRDEVIVDAIISIDGKYVYTKTGKPQGGLACASVPENIKPAPSMRSDSRRWPTPA